MVKIANPIILFHFFKTLRAHLIILWPKFPQTPLWAQASFQTQASFFRQLIKVEKTTRSPPIALDQVVLHGCMMWILWTVFPILMISMNRHFRVRLQTMNSFFPWNFCVYTHHLLLSLYLEYYLIANQLPWYDLKYACFVYIFKASVSFLWTGKSSMLKDTILKPIAWKKKLTKAF